MHHNIIHVRNIPKVLYIANNIPLPTQKSNRIVLDIAENLSPQCDISFVFPAAIVFPPFSLMKKYRSLNRLKPWTDGKFTIVPVRYLRLPGKRLSYLPIDAINPSKYVDENALPELCHAHYIMPDGYIAYKIKQKYGIPYVASVRSGDMNHVRKLNNTSIVLRKFITVLKNADKIIVHNRPQQEFVKKFGVESVMIPHGIDEQILSASLHKDDSSVIVSVVAELIQRKNIDWVIKAVKTYTGQKRIQLQIIGDGTLRNELQRLAGDADNILFLGKLSHEKVISILSKSHIFALPSINETFGLVYLEAAAQRNAVICHQNEGVDGLFEPGKEMLFCQGYNEYRDAFFELIHDQSKQLQIANAGYQKVLDYTWKNVSDKYLFEYTIVRYKIRHC